MYSILHKLTIIIIILMCMDISYSVYLYITWIFSQTEPDLVLFERISKLYNNTNGHEKVRLLEYSL